MAPPLFDEADTGTKNTKAEDPSQSLHPFETASLFVAATTRTKVISTQSATAPSLSLVSRLSGGSDLRTGSLATLSPSESQQNVQWGPDAVGTTVFGCIATIISLLALYMAHRHHQQSSSRRRNTDSRRRRQVRRHRVAGLLWGDAAFGATILVQEAIRVEETDTEGYTHYGR